MNPRVKPLAIISVAVGLVSFQAPAAAFQPQDCYPGVHQAVSTDAMKQVKSSVDQARAGLVRPQPLDESSCLDGLLDKGLKVSFDLPSFNDIIGQLKEAACDKLESQMNRQLDAFGLAKQAGIDTGNLFPGVDLGDVSGGISVGVGDTGGSYVETNAASEAQKLYEDVQENVESAQQTATQIRNPRSTAAELSRAEKRSLIKIE